MNETHHPIPQPRWLLFATAVMCLAATSSASAQSGSAGAGQTKSATCAACHGADGNSVTPIWPTLAGQHPAYTVRQLQAYKDGERLDPGMRGFASTLSDQDMQDIAAYYSAQAPAPKGTDPALVSRGQQIYRGGIPDRGIAACIACHGPTGKGNPLAAFPRVSHQHADYLEATLKAYRMGERRSDTELNQMMQNVAESLLDDEIQALASYMQGLQ